jgi:hypothetical protein
VILDTEERAQVIGLMEEAALLQGRDLSRFEKPEEIATAIETDTPTPNLPELSEVSLDPYRQFLASIPSDPKGWMESCRRLEEHISKSLTPGANIEGRNMFLQVERAETIVKLDRLIYAGVIGDAYSAIIDKRDQDGEDKPVFVKIAQGSEKNREQFTQEAEILTRVQQSNHAKHFPRIIGEGETSLRLKDGMSLQEYCYIIMDPVVGEPLPNMLPRMRDHITSLEAELVIYGWMGQYLDVMEVAQDIGVAMKDRKTSDIILQGDGNIVVVDWNAQGEYDSLTSPNRNAQFLGQLWLDVIGAHRYQGDVIDWPDNISFATKYFAEKIWFAGDNSGQRYIGEDRIRRDLAKLARYISMDKEEIETVVSYGVFEDDMEELILLDMLNMKSGLTTELSERMQALKLQYEQGKRQIIDTSKEYKAKQDEFRTSIGHDNRSVSKFSSALEAIYEGDFVNAAEFAKYHMYEDDINFQVSSVISALAGFDIEIRAIFEGNAFESIYQKHGRVDGYIKVRELQARLAELFRDSLEQGEIDNERAEEIANDYPELRQQLVRYQILIEGKAEIPEQLS